MDDGLSELRMQMSRYADARALGLEELEEFLTEVAARWNSAPFVEGVAEFAQQLGNCGVATWGDLRELDREILGNNVGMSAVHAKRFEKLVASAPYDPTAEHEPLDGEELGSEDSSRSDDEDDEGGDRRSTRRLFDRNP